MLPDVRRHLGHESNVVHSYAAIYLERLLALRDGGRRVMEVSDMAPFLEGFLEGLFLCLKKPDSGENEYIMRAIMRLVAFSG